MPYIKRQDRSIYYSVVETVLQAVPASENPLEQADYVGYFIWGVVEGFYKAGRYNQATSPFNYVCKDQEVKAVYDEQIAAALDIFGSKGIMDRGGELNYVVSAVLWGFLGDSSRFPPAKYATRAYMHGVLLRIKDQIEGFQPYGDEERRYYTLLRGVIADIMDELYRRRTAVYENQKIEENGDVWPLRVETLSFGE